MSGHTEYKRLQETDLEEGLTAVELQGRDVDGKTVAVPLYDIPGKEDKSNKGIANGYAPLDADKEVPFANTNKAVKGSLKLYGEYNGTIISNAIESSLNELALPSASASNTGWMFKVITAFSTYSVGDMIVSSGSQWYRIGGSGSGGGSNPSGTITMTGNITTDTLTDSGALQFGKNITLMNGAVARTITINSLAFVDYIKGGSGAITFVPASGRILRSLEGTSVLNGIEGSYARVKSVGNIDYLYVKNFNSVLDTDFQSVIDRISLNSWNQYPTLQKNALNAWIISTKANGNVWAKSKYIRVFALNDTSLLNASLINLKEPNGLLATVNGGVTYTANGMLYGGTTGYVNQRWMPFNDGFTVDNVGMLHDIMNDFTDSVNAFGIGQSSPTRRLGFVPRRNLTGGNVTIHTFASDFEGVLYSTPSNNRTIAFGRMNALNKYTQINNYREMSTVEAKIPLPNLEYYSGALNNNSTASGFCNGTERLVILGGSLTKGEVDQQMIINNALYTALGLPLNS